MIAYAKNYKADLTRGDFSFKDYRFYNEREWRYVPTKNNRKDIEARFNPVDYDHTKVELNDTIADIRVEFEPTDITYIIVKTIDEIEVTINSLRMHYNDKCTSKQLDILLTKIISVEQINNDF
ncbi:abortive infection system antitoxin AbiGi family protein [Mucilaginibacter sp. FT3.2]|uniref:abortive infection system antitoxin AbiGi family protein n=2 Tax=unclassified Mucilaginibacter TaxID=2617802 RepID=UPI001618E7D7|nr:abortive infection system antitoxin AbiGi family protein [Mucilaginibacter sp. FT3.2]MBB6233043.1 hypothetical protein [Mucilaginibacter sp. FT3.2]